MQRRILEVPEYDKLLNEGYSEEEALLIIDSRYAANKLEFIMIRLLRLKCEKCSLPYKEENQCYLCSVGQTLNTLNQTSIKLENIL